MNRIILAELAALAAALSLVGCSNTGKAIQEDFNQNTQAVGDAAQRAGTAVKDFGQNAATTLKLKPLVYTAVVRDPVLNDPQNHIKIQAKNNALHLIGHVQTTKMKERATDDAQKVLNDHGSKIKLSNDLMVNAPEPKGPQGGGTAGSGGADDTASDGASGSESGSSEDTGAPSAAPQPKGPQPAATTHPAHPPVHNTAATAAHPAAKHQ